MDAVGEVLAEKEKEAFPWAAGATLAAALHLGLLGAFFASSLARPLNLAPPRAVAVRILSAGSIRAAEPKKVEAAPEPVKPRIEKPPEEAPQPPSKNAVLLPAKEEKKKKPTPAPVPAAAVAPRGPDVSLPSSAEGQGSDAGLAGAGSGGAAKVGGAQFDQP